MTLGAFSTHLPTASMMLMRYADIDADRELDATRLAEAVTDYDVAMQAAPQAWAAPSAP